MTMIVSSNLMVHKWMKDNLSIFLQPGLFSLKNSFPGRLQAPSVPYKVAPSAKWRATQAPFQTPLPLMWWIINVIMWLLLCLLLVCSLNVLYECHIRSPQTHIEYTDPQIYLELIVGIWAVWGWILQLYPYSTSI